MLRITKRANNPEVWDHVKQKNILIHGSAMLQCPFQFDVGFQASLALSWASWATVHSLGAIACGDLVIMGDLSSCQIDQMY